MSLDTFYLLVNQLVSCNLNIKTFVLYHGGEPFLNKHIFSFINTIKRYWPDSFVKTVTNGSLLSHSLIQQIVSSSLDQIEISIDSISLEASQFIRRGSDSSTLISNIRLLHNALKSSSSNLELRLSSTQFFSPSVHATDPYSSTPHASWLESLFDNELSVVTTWAMQWPRIDLPDIYTVNTYQDPSIHNDYSSFCDHVVNTITVRADGSVVPCCYDLLSDLNMGNIHNNSISSIWTSSAYQDLRDSISDSSPCLTCSNCNVIRKDKRFLQLNTAL